MKWLARFFVFALMFVLGFAGASITWDGGLNDCVVDIHPDPLLHSEEPLRAQMSYGLRVMYAGLHHEASEPVLRFIIQNSSSETVTYGARYPDSLSPVLKANGRELPAFIGCGTGIKTYYISPGTSAEVYVEHYDFRELPRKSDTITAGFYLRSAIDKDYQVLTSEPFHLPDEFREAVRNHIARQP